MSRNKQVKKVEQVEQVEQIKKSTNKKMTLRSAPNSLKKIKKIVDDFVDSGRKLTPGDKFDMKMSKMFIEYLLESIDILLAGGNPNSTIQPEQEPETNDIADADDDDEDDDE